MSPVRMLNKLVAVEKLDTSGGSKKEGGGFFVVPEVSDNCGTVRFISPEAAEATGLKPGQQVYYGPHSEPIRMKGVDVRVMDISNVYGVVENESQEKA